MSEWISVKDRLPKENGIYLVYLYQECEYDRGGVILMAWYQKNNLIFVPGNIGWTLLNEFYEYSNRLRDDITHWMPLPEPPKEDAK